MLKTKPAKELILRMPNEIGALDVVAKALAERGVNILALSAWVEGAQVVIHLVSDDAVRALDAVAGRKVDARLGDVLVTELPHKPGMLRHITHKLAQGDIDIHHLYATATMSQEQCLLVFATANNDRAMVLLNAPEA
jgi:hypothetical protein